jgi:hypothetical protein
MIQSTYRSAEPVYTVILRDPAARTKLTKWTESSRSISARVEDNRMHLFDHTTFGLFMVTWTHSWDNMVIWDPWAKRHITW